MVLKIERLAPMLTVVDMPRSIVFSATFSASISAEYRNLTE
jgi:hypothetical protein